MSIASTRNEEATAVPTRLRTDLAIDSVLEELASDPEVRGGWNVEREAWSVKGSMPGTIGALALDRDGVADPALLTGRMPRQDASRQSSAPKASLTDILLAAGFCSFGAGTLAGTNRRAETTKRARKWLLGPKIPS